MSSKSRPVCVPIPIARQQLLRYGHQLALTDSDASLLALARGIAASPTWGALPGSVLMLRGGRAPRLAVMGRFDDAQAAELAVQGSTLGAACSRLRFVDSRRVEEDCAGLASLLVDRFGREALRHARFVAIPRGGLIVLGHLAYALGLEHERVESPAPSASLTILVDDCALSGTRFRDYRQRARGSRRVVFATLYSPPELRVEIESREPEVVCLSAGDLESEDLEEGWRDRFLDRMEGAYWFGKTEPLGFPWAEPDRLIWHPVRQRPTLAWRLVPPERCLENRAVGEPISVQVQPRCRGPLRPAPEVICGELDGRAVLHDLRRGESAVLDAVGSDLWRSILRHGSLARAVEEVNRDYAVSGERLRRDATELTETLVAQGLLEQVASPRDRPAGVG